MKALIIKKEWLDKIFFENKTWEMRSRITKIRGKIQLIESGSGLIVGECFLVDSFKVPSADFNKHIDKHKVENTNFLDKWNCAWVLENAIKYKEPIKYNHPKGAVIWVNL